MNTEITTLKKRPDLFPQVTKLIEEALNYPNKESYEIDFFPLMNQNNWPHNHLLLDRVSGKLIGHIGVKNRWIKYKEGRFPTALLGGLAMDKDFRGQGLFRPFFQGILDKYRPEVSFFILWSDLHQFYQKFEFELAGLFQQTGNTLLSEVNLKSHGFEPAQWNNLSAEDLKNLKEIYNSHLENNWVGLERNETDWSELMKIQSMNLFIYRFQNKLSGYFLINKGFDLPGIIHEFGHDANVTKNFLTPLMPLQLWIPYDYQLIDGQHESYLPLHTGLIRVGDKKKWEKLLRFFEIDLTSSPQKVFGAADEKGILAPKINFYICGGDSV